ncbi:hypothetical protein CFP56_000969 [Quercus suber]|uniref:Uncharacterized protein n=1 Tax=Quercus suber TaxID=58331 RepID=A0AAW0IN09_QUESU|nr:hypothetical protein CFP56_54722 [Quercus suber]
MDGPWVIESLDSLWFFTNIFAPKNKSLDSASDGIDTQEHVNDESSKEESSEPISPILQHHPDELPNDENLDPMCTKCGEFADEIEPQMANHVEDEVIELKMSAEKEERRKTRRRSKRGLSHRRKILGELDLCLDVEEVSMFSMFKETCGYRNQSFGDQHRNKNLMPSFNDNVAMKEHLKYWAYAVACTVR